MEHCCGGEQAHGVVVIVDPHNRYRSASFSFLCSYLVTLLTYFGSLGLLPL